MRSLIVLENDIIDQTIIKYNLDKQEIFDDVSYSDNGSSVIDYIKLHADNASVLPDAIFLDLYMPKYDGWTVLKELDDLYSILSKPIKVYIVSVSISRFDMIRAMKYNFVQQFISKPFTKKIMFSIANEFEDCIE